ncbi:MAG TPA: hypothetical protein VLM79_15955 [Kofleriaceae bacterium]|nr:hypothetical protein [Kofleriaceae bacterium]
MVDVLERGDISFFFRPRVQPADAPLTASVTDPGVQSFFLVLSTAHGLHRRVRVGRKRMPVAAGERLWARVERVGTLQRVLAGVLEAEEYATKTRGERYQPGARPIGQGAYALVRHDDHIHLAYRLDVLEPDVPDEARVPDSGNDIVLFERVPRERAVWTTEGEPDRLDEEGAEIVIVGVAGEPGHELDDDVLAAPGRKAEASDDERVTALRAASLRPSRR